MTANPFISSTAKEAAEKVHRAFMAEACAKEEGLLPVGELEIRSNLEVDAFIWGLDEFSDQGVPLRLFTITQTLSNGGLLYTLAVIRQEDGQFFPGWTPGMYTGVEDTLSFVPWYYSRAARYGELRSYGATFRTGPSGWMGLDIFELKYATVYAAGLFDELWGYLDILLDFAPDPDIERSIEDWIEAEQISASADTYVEYDSFMESQRKADAEIADAYLPGYEGGEWDDWDGDETYPDNIACEGNDPDWSEADWGNPSLNAARLTAMAADLSRH